MKLRFSLHLVLVAFAGVMLVTPASPQSDPAKKTAKPKQLRVIDTKGAATVLEISSARIDYTSYAFMYRPDFEYSGIRLKQGEGTVTVRWDLIDKINLSPANDGGAEAEILMRSGDTKNMGLVRWSEKGLTGKPDLGDFSIALGKVRTIEVL